MRDEHEVISSQTTTRTLCSPSPSAASLVPGSVPTFAPLLCFFAGGDIPRSPTPPSAFSLYCPDSPGFLPEQLMPGSCYIDLQPVALSIDCLEQTLASFLGSSGPAGGGNNPRCLFGAGG